MEFDEVINIMYGDTPDYWEDRMQRIDEAHTNGELKELKVDQKIEELLTDTGKRFYTIWIKSINQMEEEPDIIVHDLLMGLYGNHGNDKLLGETMRKVLMKAYREMAEELL